MSFSSTLNRGSWISKLNIALAFSFLVGALWVNRYLPGINQFIPVNEEMEPLALESSGKIFDYLPYTSIEEFEEHILPIIPYSMKKRAKHILPALITLSLKYEMNPLWVMAVMWEESHFRFSARSGVGASGLMQIMPETRFYLKGRFKRLGLTYEYHSSYLRSYYSEMFPEKESHFQAMVENIELGVFYLRLLLDKFNNLEHATIAYNMGPGWLEYRLRYDLPVGVKNRYLNKVKTTFNSLQRVTNLVSLNDENRSLSASN